MRQYFQISETGYPIISPIELEGFTAYEVGKEPQVLLECIAVLEAKEVAEKAISEWKANRQTLVDNIEVTYQGVVYQGDEVSQTRMSRAITALPDDEITITWVAKDNTEHNLNRLDIKAILFQAGLQQSNIWNLDRP